jgi:hypothetical protein
MANGTIAASQLEMLSQSGTGIITITPPATNTNRAITLPDAAGALVVSGTTPSLNGVTFPATQSASADANTLDDYEEGSWTPVAAVGFTIVGATVASGSYTKIGNLVQVTGSLGGATTIASAGGNTRITGMPFTSVSNSVCAVAFVLDDISFLSSGLFNSTGTGIYVPTFGATAADLVFQFSYRV